MKIVPRWIRRRQVHRREMELGDRPYFDDWAELPLPPSDPGRDPAECSNPGLAATVATLLEREVRPALALHRGNCQLIDVTEDGRVLLRLTGACHGCASSAITVKAGIERLLREEIAEVRGVEAV